MLETGDVDTNVDAARVDACATKAKSQRVPLVELTAPGGRGSFSGFQNRAQRKRSLRARMEMAETVH